MGGNFAFKTVVTLSSFNDYGFGHHWMTGYDHVADVLAEYCQLSGMEGVFPDLNEDA